MTKAVKITRGVDIKMFGEANKSTRQAQWPDLFAVKPPDFHGVIPKMVLKEGAEVKAGTTLFYDKERPEIKFVSPVSGELVEIKRGDKRRILEVRILPDQEVKFESFDSSSPSGLDADKIKELLLASGCWPFIKQRPYDVIANPKRQPRDIFISGFDSTPLAPDYSYLLEGQKEAFQTAVSVLSKLTSGKVYLGKRNDQTFFNDIQGLEFIEVSGPHPAGNAGVQMHKIAPVNRGEVVWTVNALDMLIIGNVFLKGKFIGERTIAVAGSEAQNPQYYKTWLGARMTNLLKEQIKQDVEVRTISGTVLTGTAIEADGFLGYYDHMLTLIPEGNHRQFLFSEGWLSLGLRKFSLSHSYFSWMNRNKKYRLDTNLNGERRPFVVTGELEKVFPFDIYPMQLLKAILVNDVELMEKLGIYEVAPEDFALCEFANTSKIDIQDLVREGLDSMRKEFA